MPPRTTPCYTAKGVASIIGGWFAATLFEQSGSWAVGFYGSAIMALVAAGLAVALAHLEVASAGDRGGAGGGEVTTESLADELSAANAARRTDLVPPSAREAAFDLAAAYAVETELVRRRRASGHATVGRKVGFANKAVWRALKLETLVWASMYDDTVHFAAQNVATLDPARLCAPKIEPEIVFKMRGAPAADAGGRRRRTRCCRVAGARVRDHRLRIR